MQCEREGREVKLMEGGEGWGEGKGQHVNDNEYGMEEILCCAQLYGEVRLLSLDG